MRTEMIAALALLGPALLACEPEDPAPFAPGRDGSIELPDTGPIFWRSDSGIDAGPPTDAGPSTDAETDDGGPVPDGGPSPTAPTVDGTIGATEWLGALERIADVPSAPPFEGDRLSRLLAIRTETRLYVAIEATLEPGHAIVMYVDADFGEPNGVLLSSGAKLADFVGTLDGALSVPLASAVLRPEYAWGTTSMPIALSGSGDLGGWRDIATNETNFATIGVSSPTRCSDTACETSIPLGLSGIASARTIAVVVRISDGVGGISGQTLPLQAGGLPEVADEVLEIPAPAGGT